MADKFGIGRADIDNAVGDPFLLPLLLTRWRMSDLGMGALRQEDGGTKKGLVFGVTERKADIQRGEVPKRANSRIVTIPKRP